MLKVKNISEVLGKKVYTSEGDFFGQIDEVNLVDNRIEGWKIKVGAGFASVLGGARGVVIPHQFVKAVGDVFIITKSMLPTKSEDSLDLGSGSEASEASEEDIL
ncbi:MAG: PRC-barrel domain-containing protein [Nanoarchaeota archaeon]|nr:PRC-barrel domain-containing protein [Nanoarchaeota archaeon]